MRKRYFYLISCLLFFAANICFGYFSFPEVKVNMEHVENQENFDEFSKKKAKVLEIRELFEARDFSKLRAAYREIATMEDSPGQYPFLFGITAYLLYLNDQDAGIDGLVDYLKKSGLPFLFELYHLKKDSIDSVKRIRSNDILMIWFNHNHLMCGSLAEMLEPNSAPCIVLDGSGLFTHLNDFISLLRDNAEYFSLESWFLIYDVLLREASLGVSRQDLFFLIGNRVRLIRENSPEITQALRAEIRSIVFNEVKLDAEALMRPIPVDFINQVFDNQNMREHFVAYRLKPIDENAELNDLLDEFVQFLRSFDVFFH